MTYQISTDLTLPRPLDEVFEFFADASNLEAIKEILSNHQNGRGRVTFKVSVKHEDFADCDVDLELKERYKISPAIRNAVASLKGVIEAKEI